tara:strand:+ start:332 stop:1030 length:699 start_codon:yes stop_codon:yes gene_type:complete
MPVDEVVSESVNALTSPSIADAVPTRRSKRGKEPPFYAIAFVICFAMIPIMYVQHTNEADTGRFTRLAFNKTDTGIQAKIHILRRPDRLHNLLNFPDKVSGPLPSLKIEEHRADEQDPPMRRVTFRISESGPGILIRHRDITPDEPHEDSGLRDLVRQIPDDRVNAYLEAAATELRANGYPELADATMIGATAVVSTEHRPFGTHYAIIAWGLACSSLVFLAMTIRSLKKNP